MARQHAVDDATRHTTHAGADRDEVPAHVRYLERADEFRGLELRERFARIFETNLWGSNESVSGTGSALEQTRAIRAQLPTLLQHLHVATMLDLPCGDFGWMHEVHLGNVAYIGADIVPDIVERNRRTWGNALRRFHVVDITSDPLPRVDLVFCRDCLVHLSNAHVWKAVENVRASRSTWLLTTTFPAHAQDDDIEDGDWRPLNLERPPFNFPAPFTLLNEGCSEHDNAFADKSLGLWRIADLPVLRLD